jgi:hypothetical protein
MTVDDDETSDPGQESVPSDERERLSPATTDGFHECLQGLVTRARSNGVDVRGKWPVVGRDDETALEIEIAQVARRAMTEEEERSDPVLSIVEAVAAREGVDVTALPPLHEVIDPEILESLSGSGDNDPSTQVTFRYCGYRVTARADGSIFVYE